ncbi:MAG TPA: Asp-tRNA(Asn)/Glu-tRNA(Gln) amidotransferase subunit GatB, partial [Candidatus Saccharibacteria bacterium]|nr:Asp-tRNA(Asn)/Glu-tRNA(Gln) amidotransferase subunit GatB [Candidatus Saccharibacteria bacterium]
LLEKGQQVVQETRGWNEATQKTTSQRSKEDAQDYRYMPDPDIPPIVLTNEDIARIQADFPKLPAEYRSSWTGFELDSSVINAVLDHQPVAKTLDAIVERYSTTDTVKRIFNWFASLQSDEIDIALVESGLVGPARLVELSEMVGDNKLSSTAAKEVFFALFDESNTGKMPEEIAKEKNLLQVSDESEIAAIVDAVLADPASAQSIQDIKDGKEKAIGYLVGQVMKQSQGRANPGLAQQLIKERMN